MTEVCPWKIRYGTTAEATTQCDSPPHEGDHSGPGLVHLFPDQRITWLAGDRREYQGEWPGYCGGDDFQSALGNCVMPLGHRGRHAP